MNANNDHLLGYPALRDLLKKMPKHENTQPINMIYGDNILFEDNTANYSPDEFNEKVKELKDKLMGPLEIQPHPSNIRKKKAKTQKSIIVIVEDEEENKEKTTEEAAEKGEEEEKAKPTPNPATEDKDNPTTNKPRRNKSRQDTQKRKKKKTLIGEDL
jgi:hypothetical protein